MTTAAHSLRIITEVQDLDLDEGNAGVCREATPPLSGKAPSCHDNLPRVQQVAHMPKTAHMPDFVRRLTLKFAV